MKRAMPWSDEDDDSSSDEDSEPSKVKPKRKAALDFEALKKHGYKGGPSILKVPPPKESDKDKDWSWSTGADRNVKSGIRRHEEEEESKEERRKTREALAAGEELQFVMTRKEKEKLSFSQKEKRKRDLGQASRGKNYVEEEKRLLRDNGVYSGFDA